MNKGELEKLSKSQLINLILQQTQKTIKPIPTPCRSEKEMIRNYNEENIIEPPLAFRDDYKPIPAPRTKRTIEQQPLQLLKMIVDASLYISYLPEYFQKDYRYAVQLTMDMKIMTF